MMDRVILPHVSRQVGREITQFTVILDLQGISLTDLASKRVLDLLGTASKMVDLYFPEIVHRIYIINSPMMFSGPFALIKPLLSARTQNRLTIVGSKYLPELEKTISKDLLPQEYGGNNPQPFDGRDHGPYVDEIALCLASKKWEPTQEERFGFAARNAPQGQNFPQFPQF